MDVNSQVLITDNFQVFERCGIPVSVKIDTTNERIVWNHNVYEKVGQISLYRELVARIKQFCLSLFKSENTLPFSPLTELFAYLTSPLKLTKPYGVYRRTQRSLKEIAEEYQKIKRDPKIADLLILQPCIREGLTMSMRGLQLVADRLIRKSHLSNVIVCLSLREFHGHLKKVARAPENSRYAFVVPCHQYCINPNPCAVVEQHMLSVLVEKVEGKMHVCVLEPMVMEKTNLDVVMDLNINSSSKSPPFSPEELVLAFAKDACPLESTTFYYSLVRRQYGLNGGCSTFALRDSIEFFRTSFFKEIQSEKTEKKGFRAITHLPPTFMQSTQSLQKIDEYVRLNPSLVKQKLGKRQLTLEESVKRRTYRKLDLNNSDKYINKYIDERTAKYQELLIEILKKATFPEKV